MLPDLKMGGGQQVLLRNITHMDPKRFANYVCYLLPFRDMESLFGKKSVPLVFLHHRAWWSFPWVLFRLVRFIRRHRIDLIHVQGTPVDKLYGHMAALLCRLPTVRTLHGMRPEPKPLLEILERPRPRQLYRWVKDRFQQGGDRLLEPLTLQHVIAVSDTVRASWWPYLRDRNICDGRITVSQNAVPVEQFAMPGDADTLKHLRQEVGVGGAYPVLINVGRLSRPKGQDLLIPMMASIVRRWPDAKLLLVGDGDLREMLAQRAAAAGLERSVILLGQRQDVPSLLAISDVFVFCSHFEGLPLVLLEAMAAGKPLVAVDLPGLCEVVQDGTTGYLVRERDAEALASAVLEVVSNRERAGAMGGFEYAVSDLGLATSGNAAPPLRLDGATRYSRHAYARRTEGSLPH
jgi:glycosyltransferase involved in cell wall biosynthesis